MNDILMSILEFGSISPFVSFILKQESSLVRSSFQINVSTSSDVLDILKLEFLEFVAAFTKNVFSNSIFSGKIDILLAHCSASICVSK